MLLCLLAILCEVMIYYKLCIFFVTLQDYMYIHVYVHAFIYHVTCALYPVYSYREYHVYCVWPMTEQLPM